VDGCLEKKLNAQRHRCGSWTKRGCHARACQNYLLKSTSKSVDVKLENEFITLLNATKA